jgi:DNA-binding HxlR family transcriptional regulator
VIAVLPNTYEGQNCAIAAALEVVGERWTMLVVRDALLGVRRFEDFQARLGISRAVLAGRLEQLVEHGVLERRLYQQRPDRSEYVLTDRGLTLWPVIAGLARLGGELVADGPPRVFRHHSCASSIEIGVRCPDCGETLAPADVVTSPGRGVPVSRAEYIAPPVLSELERERPLLQPVRG